MDKICKKGILINTKELYKYWFKEEKPENMADFLFIEDMPSFYEIPYDFKNYKIDCNKNLEEDWYCDPRKFLV